MKYFAVLLPMADVEKSKLYRSEHLEFLDQRRKEGKIFVNGRFLDGSGGLVIYQVHSLEEVEEIVKQDPYVLHGAREYRIHEWDMIK